jgi:hypothetical protein
VTLDKYGVWATRFFSRARTTGFGSGFIDSEMTLASRRMTQTSAVRLGPGRAPGR